MLGNKSRSIGKLISNSGDESIITGRIDLKCKILSPISLNSYQSNKVGLGIVAALENSGDGVEAKRGIYTRNWKRSAPIPVTGGNNSGGKIEEMEDRLEEYTYVTCHGPEESYTRVYCDGGRYAGNGGFDRRSGGKSHSVCLFHISPARFGGEMASTAATSDFLGFCHLCRKKLDGKDVYIYRGEKAFCSTECRNSQISMDEHKAKSCRSTTATATTTTSTSPHISSSSPYSYSTNNDNLQIFSLGIIAI